MTTAVQPTPSTAGGDAGQAGGGATAGDRRGVVALAAARRLGSSVVILVASAVILLGLWVLALKVLNVSPFVGKTPLDVWRYLATAPDAGANRALVGRNLGITLYDTAIGFVAGLVLGVAVAVLFTMLRALEFAFMPLVLLLRAVPLVALAPLIGIITGPGIAGAIVIIGIVVYFPVLIYVTVGLRSAAPALTDLVRANGGGPWTVLRTVAIPTALPQLFLSIRISIPNAVIGAMLYEWLFTSKGTGGEIFRANTAANYNEIWAIVVVVTGVSILLYSIVSVVESAVLAAWGPHAGSR